MASRALRLPRRVVCLVTALGPDEDPHPLYERVRAAVRGGVNMVQVRAPRLERTAFFDLAAGAAEVVGDDALLIVNNRIDVALAVDADGVQLAERGPAVNAARRAGGPDWLIGKSVHSVEGAVAAERAGAGFLVLGAIYETASHPGAPAAGPGLVHAVASAAAAPVIGIGGIDERNAPAVIAAGACGVAVIGAILNAADPERAAAGLREAVERAGPGPAAALDDTVPAPADPGGKA